MRRLEVVLLRYSRLSVFRYLFLLGFIFGISASVSAQSDIGEHPNCAGSQNMILNVYDSEGQVLVEEKQVVSHRLEPEKNIEDIVVKGCLPSNDEGEDVEKMGVSVGYEDFLFGNNEDFEPEYYHQSSRLGQVSWHSTTYETGDCSESFCNTEQMDYRGVFGPGGDQNEFTFILDEGKPTTESEVVYHVNLVAGTGIPAGDEFATDEKASYYCSGVPESGGEFASREPSAHSCYDTDSYAILDITDTLEETDGSDSEDSEQREEDDSEEGTDLSKLSFIPRGAWIDICQREADGAQISEATEEDLEQENDAAMRMTADCITDFVVPVGTQNMESSAIRLSDVQANRNLVMNSFCQSTVNTDTNTVHEWNRNEGKCVQTGTSWEEAHTEYAEQSEETEDSGEDGSGAPSCTESNSADCVCADGETKITDRVGDTVLRSCADVESNEGSEDSSSSGGQDSRRSGPEDGAEREEGSSNEYQSFGTSEGGFIVINGNGEAEDVEIIYDFFYLREDQNTVNYKVELSTKSETNVDWQESNIGGIDIHYNPNPGIFNTGGSIGPISNNYESYGIQDCSVSSSCEFGPLTFEHSDSINSVKIWLSASGVILDSDPNKVHEFSSEDSS